MAGSPFFTSVHPDTASKKVKLSAMNEAGAAPEEDVEMSGMGGDEKGTQCSGVGSGPMAGGGGVGGGGGGGVGGTTSNGGTKGRLIITTCCCFPCTRSRIIIKRVLFLFDRSSPKSGIHPTADFGAIRY